MKSHGGSTKRLILIRHGSSLANEDHNLYFTPDLYDHTIALSDAGKLQALECGKALNETISGTYTVFVSPYARATQTLDQILLAMQHEPTECLQDGRLREQEWKVFKSPEDYQSKRVRRDLRGKLYYRFKNAESGYDVLDRVGNFYNQLRMDWLLGNREDTVVVVCHDIVIRCLLMLALDFPPADFEKIHVNNCQIFDLRAGENLKFSALTDPRSNP